MSSTGASITPGSLAWHPFLIFLQNQSLGKQRQSQGWKTLVDCFSNRNDDIATRYSRINIPFLVLQDRSSENVSAWW